ncbi:MAG: hypothetical protein ACR2HR_15715 [Euzebya sp.]
MAELGLASSHALCDVDPDSVADFTTWSRSEGLADVTEVVQGDGMRALADRMLGDAATVDSSTALVHIDPFSPTATQPGSLSALELAGALIDAGAAVVYWYGFDRPEERTWAYDELGASIRATLWCGDIMVTTATGEVRSDGDLGLATTPGAGCGIVCANVPGDAVDRCEILGQSLVRAYQTFTSPTGERAALDFISRGAVPAG